MQKTKTLLISSVIIGLSACASQPKPEPVKQVAETAPQIFTPAPTPAPEPAADGGWGSTGVAQAEFKLPPAPTAAAAAAGGAGGGGGTQLSASAPAFFKPSGGALPRLKKALVLSGRKSHR